ncbi:phosphatase PAP2 family protein, partial [Micromonospora zhanjiangensis]
MRETPTVRRQTRPRPVRPAGWWYDLLLIALLAALTYALSRGQLLGLDRTVSGWAEGHRPTWAYWAARGFNLLGQGGWLLMPVAGALGGLLAWRIRSVRPALVFGAALVVLYLTVGPLKLWTDRAAPSATSHEPYLPQAEAVQIFNDLPPGTYSQSYPSGHVANALVWYGVIALLLTALLRAYGRPGLPVAAYRAIRVLPPAILIFTTTYLNFHWFTDGVAGLLVGLILRRLLDRVPWDDLPLPTLPGGWDRPARLDPPDR